MVESGEIIPLISKNGQCVSHENCVEMEGRFCENGKCVKHIGEGYPCHDKNGKFCDSGLVCRKEVRRCLPESFVIPNDDSCEVDNHCTHKMYCYGGKCLFKVGLNGKCSKSSHCLDELACFYGTCLQRCMDVDDEIVEIEPSQVQYYLKTGRCPYDKVCRVSRDKMICQNIKRGSIEFQFVWRYAVWYASIIALFVVVIRILKKIRGGISSKVEKQRKKKSE